MGKKILMLLTNEFRPDPRVAKEAIALVSSGYQVTVLAWDRGHRTAISENHRGTFIERIRTGKVNGLPSLILNYPLFFFRSLSSAMSKQIDIVHSHDLDTLLLGVVISAIKGAPLVYDAHEHYAKMVASDLPEPLARMLDTIESVLVRRARLVIAANEKIEEYLRPRAKNKTVVVANCIDLPPEAATVRELQGRLILFYAGALEPLRYIEECIDIVRSRNDCSMIIAGHGRLEEHVKRNAGESIIFLGYLNHGDMMERLSRSDAVLCLMDQSNENNQIGTPNKLYESMAAGVPLIVSRGTLAGRIVSEERCGVVMDWSREEFLSAIALLKNDEERKRMGRSGRKAAERDYNWSIMRERLINAYDEL